MLVFPLKTPPKTCFSLGHAALEAPKPPLNTNLPRNPSGDPEKTGSSKDMIQVDIFLVVV